MLVEPGEIEVAAMVVVVVVVVAAAMVVVAAAEAMVVVVAGEEVVVEVFEEIRVGLASKYAHLSLVYHWTDC